jgi:hypothetical protein
VKVLKLYVKKVICPLSYVVCEAWVVKLGGQYRFVVLLLFVGVKLSSFVRFTVYLLVFSGQTMPYLLYLDCKYMYVEQTLTDSFIQFSQSHFFHTKKGRSQPSNWKLVIFDNGPYLQLERPNQMKKIVSLLGMKGILSRYMSEVPIVIFMPRRDTLLKQI